MYFGSPDVYFHSMGNYGIKITCVNCESELTVMSKFSNSGIHNVCPYCHEYAETKVKKHKIACKHCFAGNHFDNGEDMTHCRKCGKSFSEEVEKNRKCNATIIMFSGHNSIISQRYL